MARAYYADSIERFCVAEPAGILGQLNQHAEGAVEPAQREAWARQIVVLQAALAGWAGRILFEFSIPRMGRRIDVVVVCRQAVLVLEFKCGPSSYPAGALDQVWDYALELKNFHETSHACAVAPVLVVPDAPSRLGYVVRGPRSDHLFDPVTANAASLCSVLAGLRTLADGPLIDVEAWEVGRYSPTPTIIEAALALYRGHSVQEISRSDAGARNLSETTGKIAAIIAKARARGEKAICFVTGVPGAGKTLVGLHVATQHMNHEDQTRSVFLSGNGPLVRVLHEALARDLVARRRREGVKITKAQARTEVKAFVQNVHHYRDAYLVDPTPPADHVALFDEAQRAWDLPMTVDFMARKKNRPGFHASEPEFLISCVDRHPDWGVVVCLVGGGQEINRGEAGIGEWIEALLRSFEHWRIHLSPRLTDSEYGAGAVLDRLRARAGVSYDERLHLNVSMRSFRAEKVSLLVKQVLDVEREAARATWQAIRPQYPIMITRDVQAAKQWLRDRARGTERYGLVVSSYAERLKPHAMDVKSPMDPVHWFLHGKDDVRSSYYLESVATEFSIQGLELDWACVTWDADFRFGADGWAHRQFRGSRWEKVVDPRRQLYQKNAYRVLLTRARQGMVLVVPRGDPCDPTRLPAYYDGTYAYLREIGLEVLGD